MRFLDKLERRFGGFAIKNLALYVIIGNAAVWLVNFAVANVQILTRFALIPVLVFKGEVWRIISFVFLTSFGGSLLSVALELYFIYIVGSNLEYSWGSFRLTIYYFAGLILTVIVSLTTGTFVFSARYIHLSLFFAFAQLVPDMQVRLFFIIPIKIKWLAWLSWAFTALELIRAESWGDRLVILAPIVVFLMFFWNDIIYFIRGKRRSSSNRSGFRRKVREAKLVKASFHKCDVCGITEIEAPSMDFRYCSKCEGNHEFCMNHLNDHIHYSG